MAEPPSFAAAGSVGTSQGPGADTTVLRLGPSAAGRCRRRIHLDARHADERAPVSDSVRRVLDELAAHREQVLTAIRAGHDLPPAGRDLPHAARDLPPDPGADTDDWRRQRQPIVLLPSLTTGARAGSPDLLLWVGDGYQPVIIRAHRTRDAGSGARVATLADPTSIRVDPAHRSRRHRADRLALAHHYRQLAELGLAATSARGGVIGRGHPTDGAGPDAAGGAQDDAAVIVWHQLDTPGSSSLDDYDLRFTDRIAVATSAALGGPALAFPSRVAECRRCPWWPRCRTELESAQDISLLLAGDDVQIARAAGVGTIGALAELPAPAMAALTKVLTQSAHAQVRARAWLRGAPLVPVGPGTAVTRADVEVDIDAESYGEDGAYLWGALLSGTDVGIPAGYRSFVTWEPLPSAGQGRVFGEFFTQLLQIRDAAAHRGLSFAVFCYGKAAEERWMLGLARRYSGMPGIPTEQEVTAFCASTHWVDLMQEIRQRFVLPGSLRLKEIATAVGFSWRDPEPGGENSMAWYRAAIGLEGESADGSLAEQRPAPDNAMAQRVLQYNEDDVLATLAVRRWITEHLATLPTAGDLTGPAVGGPGAAGAADPTGSISGAASAATRPAG